MDQDEKGNNDEKRKIANQEISDYKPLYRKNATQQLVEHYIQDTTNDSGIRLIAVYV